MATIQTSTSTLELTPSQKGKITKALKSEQFIPFTSEAQQIAIREMVTLFVLSDRAVDFGAIVTELELRAKPGEPVSQPDKPVIQRGKPALTFGDALLKAQEILGEQARIWTAVSDSKGVAFPTPRVRVGLPLGSEGGLFSRCPKEQGCRIVGTGYSNASAVADTRKRVEAAKTVAPVVEEPRAEVEGEQGVVDAVFEQGEPISSQEVTL